MVKNYFIEVTQNTLYELILLLKVYMPSNKTKAVLFLTKNEKADPDLGVNHTPKVGCFSTISKYSFLCCFITQLIKKLQQWSLYEVIEDILSFDLSIRPPLSDI